MNSGSDTFIVIAVSPKPPDPCGTSELPVRKRMSPSCFGFTAIEGGLPHSEILGSKLVRSSPRLIAAYHVLHRLSAPRHPPNALLALDRSHDQCPPRIQTNECKAENVRKTFMLAEHTFIQLFLTDPLLIPFVAKRTGNGPKEHSEECVHSLQ